MGARPARGRSRDGRHVGAAARPDQHSAQTRDRSGQPGRCGRHGRPQGQPSVCGRDRLTGQPSGQADAEGRDLPHLLDDQAAGVAGGDDAGRGRQDPAHRSGLEVPPRVEADAGERSANRSGARQDQLHAGVGAARDDRAGPAAPFGGIGLRADHAEHAGEGSLYQGPALRRRRRLRSARPLAFRVRGCGGAQPARASARHGVGVQHRDRRAGTRRRSGFRTTARGISRATGCSSRSP